MWSVIQMFALLIQFFFFFDSFFNPPQANFKDQLDKISKNFLDNIQKKINFLYSEAVESQDFKNQKYPSNYNKNLQQLGFVVKKIQCSEGRNNRTVPENNCDFQILSKARYLMVLQ